MKQRYDIWVGESRSTRPQTNCAPDFRVFATNHRQHIWNETYLEGVAKKTAAKINALAERHQLITHIAGRDVRLLGANI